MAVIGVKSITGITSITNAAGGSDVLTFHSNNTTERLRITSDGQLLHTANKASGYIAEFHQDNASNSGQILIDSPTNNDGRPSFIDLSRAGTLQWSIGQGYNHSGGAFHFATSNLGAGITGSKLTITSTGKVGIGEVSPDEILHITKNDTTGPTVVLENSANKTYINNWGSNGPSGRQNRFEINATATTSLAFGAQYIAFATGGIGDSNEKLRITSGGKIGINSTSPTYALEVDGGTQNTVIAVRSSDAKAAISFMDYTSGGYGRATIGGQGDQVYITTGSGTERIRFGTGGNSVTTGISTTLNMVTNSEVLAVRGYSSFKSTSKDYAALYVGSEGNTNNNINALILFNDGTANRSGIGYVKNTGEFRINNQYFMTFTTGASTLGGTERLRIHADGEVEIKAAANGQTVLSCTGAYASSSTVDVQTWARSDGAVKAAMKYSHGANNFTVGTATNHVFGIRTNNSERIRIANSSAATSIGGAMSYNAMLTTQGDVSGGLLMLKAAENTNRLFISGNDTSDVEVNFYDKNGGQRGILVGGETGFAIKAPNSSAPIKFFTNDGNAYAERVRFNNSGGIDLHKTGCNRGLIWIHEGDGGDACTSMANVQGSGGRGLISNKMFNIAANTTTDFAKSHWGGLVLIGWAGTGHQGMEQVMFGYNQT